MDFASVVSDWRTIAAVVGALLLWAVWSGASLYTRTRRLIAILGRGRGLVEEAADPRAFAASFEATARQIADLPVLNGPWSAYRDTLIVPDDGPPSRPVRSTLRPDQVFDLGLLRAAGLRPRYHAAMPGLLVGAGLLFTFLGLAVALAAAGGVVAGGDPVQSRQELHKLLDAASFKFITSLAGLFLSIAYTLVRNGRIRVVEQALDAFNAALDRQMPLATPAFLQHEANETLRAQSATLETFGTELAVNIGQALDSAFDKRLGEHIAPLTEAMQALADRTSDAKPGCGAADAANLHRPAFGRRARPHGRGRRESGGPRHPPRRSANRARRRLGAHGAIRRSDGRAHGRGRRGGLDPDHRPDGRADGNPACCNRADPRGGRRGGANPRRPHRGRGRGL